MIVYLVRHGETAINKQYRFLGHFDVDLSTEGVKQAEVAAGAIANAARGAVNTKSNIKLYSSDLARTIRTAGIVANGLQASRTIGGAAQSTATSREAEMHGTKDLREIDFGDWEGLTYDEIKSVDGAQFDAWLADYTSVKIPGGESWADFTSRITGAVLDILNNSCKDDTIVIVTHGGPIRLITSCFIEDVDHFQNFWPAPGSVHMLDVVKRVTEQSGERVDSNYSLNGCASRDTDSAGKGTNYDADYGVKHENKAHASGEGDARKNNRQTVACLRLSRAYKIDNYRLNLQIS